MKNPLDPRYSSKVLSLLVAGWLLCMVLAALIHWRVFSFLAVALLIGAIVFFMISIVYAMIGKGDSTNKPTPQDKDQSCHRDPSSQ